MPIAPAEAYLEIKMNTAREGRNGDEVARSVGADAGQPADTAAALRLFVVLSRAFRALSEHVRQDVERHGLGQSEFSVLEILYSKGRLPLGEVASGVLLTSGSTTYVIDKLEQRGLLTRIACPSDRRVTWAELTDEGRGLMARVFPEHAAALRAAMEGLTTEEKRIAAALLKRLGLHARDALQAQRGT